MMENKKVQYLVVDTTAFIQNAPLQNIATTIITCPEVVNEVTDKRQLRRLVALPYDLEVKEVFPENVKIITDFSKKTGDYPSLSATDIKVMALTYQLEKEKVGIEHLRTEPIIQRPIITTKNAKPLSNSDVGFYNPNTKKVGSLPSEQVTDKDVKLEEFQKSNCNDDLERLDDINCDINKDIEESESDQKIIENSDIKHEELDGNPKSDLKLEQISNLSLCDSKNEDNIELLKPVTNESNLVNSSESHDNDNDDSEEDDDNEEDDDDHEEDDDDDDDDGEGWITPSNIQAAKKQINSELMEDKSVTVACITTDFAMQNVLKQMNLNVTALDGRLIKRLRTYILRCYSCFKTTSIMTKRFCPSCGNDTLKKVGVSLDKNGKMVIHINKKRPLTARGKKFSLPRMKGGKHPNNPILVADQPMPDNRPTRLARMKNNPLDDDYIAGFSPFVMRDINSKSAQLCIRPNQEVKYWMRKNPNESRRRKK